MADSSQNRTTFPIPLAEACSWDLQAIELSERIAATEASAAGGALFRNPFTRGVVRAAGYCSNATTADMVELSAEALAQGQSLIMFPEGTRTRPGRPLEFHRGVASVAVRAARVVTPVFIRVSPTTLTKSEPWYHIPDRRPHWRLCVGDDLLPAGDLRGAAPPVASRRFNQSLLDVFQKDLATAGDEI